MPRLSVSPKYVIISPVKDEQEHIAADGRICAIADCSTFQDRIIVDDASRDHTCHIINTVCSEVSWIEVIHRAKHGRRQPGSAVIHAFNAGYEALRDTTFEFIVKLDCDLRFFATRLFRETIAGVRQRSLPRNCIGHHSGGQRTGLSAGTNARLSHGGGIQDGTTGVLQPNWRIYRCERLGHG